MIDRVQLRQAQRHGGKQRRGAFKRQLGANVALPVTGSNEQPLRHGETEGAEHAGRGQGGLDDVADAAAHGSGHDYVYS